MDDADVPKSAADARRSTRDYEVGYCKPPKHTRFKKGVCPNPSGRGKRSASSPTDAVLKVLNEKTSFLRNGRVISASRDEMAIDRHIAAALRGDVEAAAWLLKIWRHAEKHVQPRKTIIKVRNALPLPPGLILSEKSRED
jgi:hypothetical protein